MSSTPGLFDRDALAGKDDSVVIINPIHVLYGQRVAVRKVKCFQGGYIEITIEHPNGNLLSLSLADTSPGEFDSQLSTQKTRPLFNPSKLLRLAEFLSHHLKP